MRRDRFERWLKNIHHTREQEISCSECFDQVSHFVDVELAGEDAASRMPLLRQHLDQCATCREEYDTLRDLRWLEKGGQLPSVDDLRDLLP